MERNIIHYSSNVGNASIIVLMCEKMSLYGNNEGEENKAPQRFSIIEKIIVMDFYLKPKTIEAYIMRTHDNTAPPVLSMNPMFICNLTSGYKDITHLAFPKEKETK